MGQMLKSAGKGKNKPYCRETVYVVRDFAAAFLVLCVFLAAGASAQNKRGRLEDHPDYAWVEKRFDEVYHEASAAHTSTLAEIRPLEKSNPRQRGLGP